PMSLLVSFLAMCRLLRSERRKWREVVGPGPVGGGGERNRARAPRSALKIYVPEILLSHIDQPRSSQV
ncbi:MAG TPA: hypothetical protein VNT92_00185, partial [Acidimicrobiia bacterium]|nr:hypothetical protein [Acidimicrobiia bacterium]